MKYDSLFFDDYAMHFDATRASIQGPLEKLGELTKNGRQDDVMIVTYKPSKGKQWLYFAVFKDEKAAQLAWQKLGRKRSAKSIAKWVATRGW